MSFKDMLEMRTKQIWDWLSPYNYPVPFISLSCYQLWGPDIIYFGLNRCDHFKKNIVCGCEYKDDGMFFPKVLPEGIFLVHSSYLTLLLYDYNEIVNND